MAWRSCGTTDSKLLSLRAVTSARWSTSAPCDGKRARSRAARSAIEADLATGEEQLAANARDGADGPFHAALVAVIARAADMVGRCVRRRPQVQSMVACPCQGRPS